MQDRQAPVATTCGATFPCAPAEMFGPGGDREGCPSLSACLTGEEHEGADVPAEREQTAQQETAGCRILWQEPEWVPERTEDSNGESESGWEPGREDQENMLLGYDREGFLFAKEIANSTESPPKEHPPPSADGGRAREPAAIDYPQWTPIDFPIAGTPYDAKACLFPRAQEQNFKLEAARLTVSRACGASDPFVCEKRAALAATGSAEQAVPAPWRNAPSSFAMDHCASLAGSELKNYAADPPHARHGDARAADGGSSLPFAAPRTWVHPAVRLEAEEGLPPKKAKNDGQKSHPMHILPADVPFGLLLFQGEESDGPSRAGEFSIQQFPSPTAGPAGPDSRSAGLPKTAAPAAEGGGPDTESASGTPEESLRRACALYGLPAEDLFAKIERRVYPHDRHTAGKRRWDWSCSYALLEIYMKHHRPRVPERLEVFCRYDLGSWCKAQRREREKKRLGAWKVRYLDALPEWRWRAKSVKWLHRYTELQEHLLRHHETPRQSRRRPLPGEADPALGEWCARQRGRYKRGELSPERAQKLEALPGWWWRQGLPDWEEGLRLLHEFRKAFGRLPETFETFRGARLGQWGLRQRRAYEDGFLFREKVRVLDELDPDWTRKFLTWNEYLGVLEEHLGTKGSYPSRLDRCRGLALGEWWAIQLAMYRAGRLLDVQRVTVGQLLDRFGSACLAYSLSE